MSTAPVAPAVLVIGGIDSSGGAGVSRDVRTLTELGMDALCVVTAVTAQSNSEVAAVHHVPSWMISAQIKSASKTREIAAIKIGMLGTATSVNAVASALLPHAGRTPIILDPVLAASSGGVLLDAEGCEMLLKHLIPVSTLVTPNLHEAAVLLGPNTAPAADEESIIAQAKALLALGPAAVLIKGGHGTGDEAVDYLVSESGSMHRFALPRVNATRRGTGCALASAIAAGLASGAMLEEACEDAKEYVHGLLS